MICILIIILLFLNSFGSFGVADKIKGVNIGGWLVLEPWITPSLFYSFLGNNSPNRIGMDMYTFCEILGPIKANKILRSHWSSWITEKHIQLFIKNKINLLRVPVGDWMYIPYEPFDVVENNTRCMDGSIEVLDNLFHLAEKYNIRILLDLHGVKGSQNGFDNSGQAIDVRVVNNSFIHWPIRSAKWVGEFDQDTKTYINWNEENIQHSKRVLTHIIRKYYSYPMLYGLCVLNEPWEYTPELFLKNFYQDIFDIFSSYMSNDKVFVIHDAFRSDIWVDFEFLRNDKQITILIDTHQYTAWNNPYMSFNDLILSSNNWQSPKAKYKYIIGEWSLAIDNCEMWLNGFMDNLPNYPLFECAFQICPYHDKFYVELSQSFYGPFGTGISCPNKNRLTGYFECPISIPLSTHFTTSTSESELAERLFTAKSNAFEKETEGWIFWNFRTESSSYAWDYLAYITIIEDKLLDLLDQNINENENNKTDSIKNKSYLCPEIACIFVLFCLPAFAIHMYVKMRNRYRGYSAINNQEFKKPNYQSI